MLVIDWGSQNGLHVFCAVLAWSRVRFVRFAGDERAETTMAMLAECFAQLGGAPKVVLADRMGCLKGGVVANVVVPAPSYVRFASHYRFRPDFCEANDPESKGIVENLVGYAKRDLLVPQAPFTDLAAANEAARVWCAEVNAVVHSPDRRDPGRAVGPRGRAVGRAALAAAAVGHPHPPQGGPALVCAVQVGPLLRAHQADRHPRGIIGWGWPAARARPGHR
jgi:hypothetical protein